MTGRTAQQQTDPVFVCGNEHLDRLLSDPQIAADVQAAADQMDRVYAMNMAMVRKAAQMSQVEVARKLGVAQGAVSRLQNGQTCFCRRCMTT